MSKYTYYGNKDIKYYGSVNIDYDGTLLENINGNYELNVDGRVLIRSGYDNSSADKSFYLQSRNGGDFWITADWGGNSGDLNLVSNNQMNITTYSGGADGSDINITCGQDLLANADGAITITSGNDSLLSVKNVYIEAKNSGDVTIKSGDDTKMISNDRFHIYPNDVNIGTSVNSVVEIGNYGRLWFHDGQSSNSSPNYHFALYRYQNSASKNQMVIHLNESDSGILIKNDEINSGEIKLDNYITKNIFISPFSFVGRNIVDLDGSGYPYYRGYYYFVILNNKDFDLYLDLSTVLPDLSIVKSFEVYLKTFNFWDDGEYVSLFMDCHRVQIPQPPTSASDVSDRVSQVYSFPHSASGETTLANTFRSYVLDVSDDNFIIDHNNLKQLFLRIGFDGAFQAAKTYYVFGVKITYKSKNPTCFGSTSNYSDYST